MQAVTRLQANTNTAAALVADGSRLRGAIVYNAGTATVYLDSTNAVANTGFPLDTGKSISASVLKGPIYAICPTAAMDLRVLNNLMAE